MYILYIVRRVGFVDFLMLKLCIIVVICEWKEDKKKLNYDYWNKSKIKKLNKYYIDSIFLLNYVVRII